MQMCESFSNFFDEVELWTSRSHNTEELKKIKDVFAYYSLKKSFTIKSFFQFDSIILRNLNEFIWANIKGLIFALNICMHLVKYRNSDDIIIYTRDWYLLMIFQILKKIRIVNNKIFYESHKFSKLIIRFAREIDGLIVINRHLRDLYKKNGIENILIAHDGVNMSTFRYDEENSQIIDQLEIFKNKKVLTYIGSFKTLGNEKGIEDIIKAIPYLKDKKVSFAFIGGPMGLVNGYLNLAKSLNIALERLIFIDRQPIAYMKFYMKQSKALLMPFPFTQHYAYYMSPLKMFEYMTSKVPIIASNLPSILEVLRDRENAIICEPDNPKDIAQKIEYILENDCTQIANRAFDDVTEFTWEKRAEKIHKFMTLSV
jgi:glycosyltransferase involved in cell wall biosynthesis